MHGGLTISIEDGIHSLIVGHLPFDELGLA